MRKTILQIIRKGVLSALLAALGCSGEPRNTGFVARDSAGIAIIENATAEPGFGVQPTERPAVTIGSESDPLFRVVSVTRLRDGGIVVANAGSFEIRIYNEDGSLRTAFGRNGNGPGEFASIYGVYRIPGDSIAVFDSQLQRMTVFTADGEPTRSYRMQRNARAGRVTPAGMMPNGEWLVIFSDRIASELSEGTKRLPLYIYGYDSVGEPLGRLTTVSGYEVYVHVTEAGRVVLALPFGRGVTAVASPQGFIVAASDNYEISFYDPKGQLERIVRSVVEPRKVTNADVRAAEETLLEASQPPQKSLVQSAFQVMPIPESFPAIGAEASDRSPWIVVQPEGGFWVRRYSGPGDQTTTWDVFSSVGRLQGKVRFNGSFALHDVGDDYALGVRTDSLGAEQVVLYPLQRQ